MNDENDEYEVLQTFDTSNPAIVVDLVVLRDSSDLVKVTSTPVFASTALRIRLRRGNDQRSEPFDA